METRRVILVLKIAVGIILVALCSIIVREDSNLAHRPVVEDGYYAFTVARNIALGKGITVDGTQQTNGFQPLFTFLTVPAFIIAGGDRYEAIRIVLILHLLVLCSTSLVLGQIGKRFYPEASLDHQKQVFWWIILIFTSSILTFVVSFNGLETGLLLFMYATVWLRFQAGDADRLSGLAVMGILFGLTVLTRIDALLVVIAFALFLFARAGKEPMLKRLAGPAVVVAVALIVSSPWWIFNKLSFGSFMPTSGNAYRAWITPSNLTEPFVTERLWDSVSAFSRTMMPILYLGQNTFENALTTIVRLAFISGMGYALWKSRSAASLDAQSAPAGSKRRTIEYGLLFFVSIVGLISSYTLSFSAIWFYTRYFSPLLVVSTVVLGCMLARIPAKYSIAAMAFIALLAGQLVYVVNSVHSDRFRSEYIDDQIALIERKVPADKSVAAFQTGTLGYFRDLVVNLDGKVNPEAVARRTDLLGYVESKNVRWLCDNPEAIEGMFGISTLRDHQWIKVGEQGRFVLYEHQ